MDERISTFDKNLSPSTNTLVNTSNTNNQSCEKLVKISVSMKSTGSCKYSSEVLLSTAVIYIRDNEDRFHRARALLNNGLQSNFVTKSLCQRLKLNVNKTKHTISYLKQRRHC